MTASAVTNSNNRHEDMEGAGPTIWGSGGGKGGGLETVTFLQGIQSISRKATAITLTAVGAVVTSIDVTAANDNRVLMSKSLVSNYLAVNAVGWIVGIGSGIGNQRQYILADDGTLGDRSFEDIGLLRGGWIVEAIEADNEDWWDQETTAPTLTAVTHIESGAGFSAATAKSENIFLDSIDFGDGLYIVEGGNGNDDAVWLDFLAHDQGQATTGRIGHVVSNASGIEVRGKMIRGRTSAGTVTRCNFTDTLQNLTWVASRVSAGWNELEDDLGNAGTAISETNSTFTGAGRDNLKRYFDTDHEVNATDDVIEIVAHGFFTGEAVLYTQVGTETPGPTTATRYFVNRTTGTGRDADGFSLHTTRANAYANTSPVALTASTSGNGENHYLQRRPDTRPDYTATSSTGTATYTGCNFIRFRDFVATSGLTITSCTIVDPNSFALGGATLSGCTIDGATTTEGEGLFTGTVANVELITDTSFTAGSTGGHAIEVTGTASALDIVGITFTGYGPDPEAGDGHSFDTTNGAGVDDTNDEINYTSHGWTSGDPAYYSRRDPADGTLGTDAIGLADGDLVYVRSVDANNFSLHPTRFAAEGNLDKIVLNNTGTGEIHTFYSADAAIVNNTAGAMTVNVTGGGNAPSMRNVGASTSTVVSAVTITINGLSEGSRAVMIGNGGAEDGNELLGGYATSAGVVTGSFSGTTPQAVIVKARNAGIINAAIQDDGTVFTDFTDDARSSTGAPGTGSTDDVDLTATTPAVSDAFYFGGVAIFEEICLNITTAGVDYTGSWDYWNGAWVALTVTDETDSFKTAGRGLVEFTAPGDWATTSVNSQGPFFYVRFTVDTIGTPTQAQADSITLNKTTKYLPFNSTGSIEAGTGLTSTAVWIRDTLVK